MNKRGFTLAEILITLGIVGVIAALTMPVLVTNSRNQANASRLSATVSSLENAFSSAIARDGASDIYETDLWESFDTKFVDLIQASKYDGDKFYGDIVIKGLHRGKATTPSGTAFLLKSGATVFVSDVKADPPDDNAAVATLGGALHSPAAKIAIDVNGTSAPNMYGRDIFFYTLGDNGHLYPYGGRDVSIASDGTTDNLWTNKEGHDGCLPNTEGSGCAARLMEEGYKMNY